MSQLVRISLQGIDQEIGVLRWLVEMVILSEVEVVQARQGHSKSVREMETEVLPEWILGAPRCSR